MIQRVTKPVLSIIVMETKMLGTMPEDKHETWRSRLWRFLADWEAALDSDPIECLERRVSALEREMRRVSLQRANIAPGGKPLS